MRSVRVLPHLRSSVVEEKPADQLLLFTSRRSDADDALVLGDPTVRPFSWGRFGRAVLDPDVVLLEVAEPLWLGEWVRALRYVLLAKTLRLVAPSRRSRGSPGSHGSHRRRRIAAATYAIDNLDARTRLRPPALDARPRLGAAASRVVTAAVGVSLRSLDVVAFGTTGAYENYRQAFGRSLRRTTHAVLPPRVDACRVCRPGTAPRERTVLFLGAPSTRKGFGVLAEAWELAGAARLGWRLVVADPDGATTPELPTGVSVRTGLSRDAVHALLRSATAVAMPSVRLPRWREQIGLPLVEGLAHGCRVVTTTESGLADDVRGHPLVTLTTPGDARSLADGLHTAMAGAGHGQEPGQEQGHDAGGGSRSGWSGWSKVDVVRWWLTATACDGGHHVPRHRQ